METDGHADKRADFDAADMAQWTGMVTRLLKGAPVDSLDRRRGRACHECLLSGAAPDGVPPPLLPMNAARRPVAGWRVVQTVPADMGMPKILDALMSGATGLMLSNADEDALARSFRA